MEISRTRKTLGLLIPVLSLCANFAIANGQSVQLEAQRDGNIKEILFETPAFTSTVQGSLRWQKEIVQIGARYIRVRISDVQLQGAGKVTLSLRDRSGRLVRKYTGKELATGRPIWSDVIPGSYVLISLMADQTPHGFGLKIDRIAYQAFAGAPLSTVGEDEKQPIADYLDDETISRLQRSIARLLFISDGGSSTCTGFLIAPGQLMTNHHCVSTQEVCRTMRAIFGYQYDKNGELQFGDQYECRKIVDGKIDYSLDFSILEIAGKPENEWGMIAIGDSVDPSAGDPLFIVQHPAGEPKQISRINCVTSTVPVDGRASVSDFTHTCDTVGGSSGAPVFSEIGELVGLHHYGFSEGGDWTKNRAIRMKQIIKRLAQ